MHKIGTNVADKNQLHRIGLALSGGGSRAVAFHLGCLRALHDLGILKDINVVSTISGGSVIGAYYAYTPQMSFSEFESNVRSLLSKGFHRRIALELFKPWNFARCASNLVATKFDGVISKCTGNVPRLRRFPSRTDMFDAVMRRDLFPELKMSSPRRGDLEIVIGACEMRTGSAFRFGNTKSGGWRHGEIVGGDVGVSFAVAASAAYPIFLPAFDRKLVFMKDNHRLEHRVLLTDGGVYDNLGVQVLEPGRDPSISVHNFPCDYIIACNAGHGQDAGDEVPIGFLPRVQRAFEIVHRRVQDSTMHRLHHLRDAGAIKGFALPYLGQQDKTLPGAPASLVPRSEVIKYPTDFAAMTPEWINKLSSRGEHLTRLLVSAYLPSLLTTGPCPAEAFTSSPAN